ncbi:MAG: DUF5615 family PIN-like protein [Myxococcota bacterium]
MKLLLDMNLSPAWCEVLSGHGWEAVHWSMVGSPTAPDVDVMRWARTEGHVVITSDLDFSVLLATTRAGGPSVVQLRAGDVTPAALASILVAVLQAHEGDLIRGALVTVDEATARVRVLPL